MGYWVGKQYWNQGFCTEAASALLAYGFEELDLNRICATHLVRNPASGRVMEKLGMRKEGVLRDHFSKWDKYEDVVYFGILKREWEEYRQ